VKQVLDSADKMLAEFSVLWHGNVKGTMKESMRRESGFGSTLRGVGKGMKETMKNFGERAADYEKIREFRDLLADLWVRPYSPPEDRIPMGDLIKRAAPLLNISQLELAKRMKNYRKNDFTLNEKINEDNPVAREVILASLADDEYLLSVLLNPFTTLMKERRAKDDPKAFEEEQRQRKIMDARSTLMRPELRSARIKRSSITEDLFSTEPLASVRAPGMKKSTSRGVITSDFFTAPTKGGSWTGWGCGWNWNKWRKPTILRSLSRRKSSLNHSRNKSWEKWKRKKKTHSTRRGGKSHRKSVKKSYRRKH
jgi:hypothetical protein